MVPLLVAGLATGAAGQAANYFGGKNEAKRRKNAIGDYERDSAALYEEMARDAWNQGGERQKATGQVIAGLKGAMGGPATVAPQVASYLPADVAVTGRGSAYDNVLQQSMQPQQAVTQAGIDADQAGMDRGALARALDELGFSSSVEGQTNAPAHVRLQWQKRRELEAAKARLESILGSIGNKTRNLQLLGSLLGTAGQGMTMAAGNMGGPGGMSPQAAMTARQASSINTFNGAR